MVSHRSPRHPVPPAGAGRPTRAVVLSAAAGAAVALIPAPSGAEPGGESAAGVNDRVDRLYSQAERATEKYNASAEKAERLRERVEYAQDRAARGQAKVNRLRNALGSLAGAQYRAGGIDPAVVLLLSDDPDSYLDKAATLDRIGSRQRDELRELRGAQRSLEQQRAEATRTLAELERQRTALRRHKKSVQGKLGSAQRLLNRLSPQERAARARGLREGLLGEGEPGTFSGLPASTARAAAAVAAARSAVGSPYAWGQAGPRAFDCSGLTQWAYRQAGVALPRTSQGQGSAGQRVPLAAARPGDLVVYRDDASHVAMYMGNGQVVHAPHPGAQVRYDPVGMMPVSAVTRP